MLRVGGYKYGSVGEQLSMLMGVCGCVRARTRVCMKGSCNIPPEVFYLICSSWSCLLLFREQSVTPSPVENGSRDGPSSAGSAHGYGSIGSGFAAGNSCCVCALRRGFYTAWLLYRKLCCVKPKCHEIRSVITL